MSGAEKLLKLKSSQSIEDLADLVGYKTQSLAYIVYGRHKLGISNYYDFEIDKSNGEKRKIKAPLPELKLLQRRTSKLLQDVNESIMLSQGMRDVNGVFKGVAHGFFRGKSIITNASVHKNKSIVLNIDLKDFFDSINFGRVRGYFLSNKFYNLNPKIATLLAQIVCHENKLPQGAPSSPVISNMIASILDIKLLELAKKNKCHYSRYVDDITFSTNLNVLPHDIVSSLLNGKVEIGIKLTETIKSCGFELNDKKTRVQFNSNRQDVTGLIVNRKVNVKKEYRDRARVLTNRVFSNKEIYKIDGDKDKLTTLNYLGGVLGYIYQVRKKEVNLPSKQKIVSKEQMDNLLDSNARLYRDFIFFKRFVFNDYPLILCEGKTDRIYLKAAIGRLKDLYPQFVEEKDGKLNSKLDLMNYSKVIGELFQLKGGSGDLSNLIVNYEKYISKFKRFRPSQPVIMLIDNDSGAEPIRKIIYKNETTKKKSGVAIPEVKFDKKMSYLHINNNLYIMQTPLSPDGRDSKIEDFFCKETLEEQLSGKSFSPENTFNISTHYSKAIFAEHVVEKKKKEINFDGFKYVFDTLSEVLEHYKKFVNPQ